MVTKYTIELRNLVNEKSTMRNLSIFIFFTSVLNVFSQSEKIIGEYENKTKFKSGITIEYELSLNSDGTFLFHFYQDQMCYEDDDRAKGKWTIENDTILFRVNKKTDFDKNHQLDFKKTKAKFMNGFLRFFESEIIWVNELELKKKTSQLNLN